jgi:non-specific serine/threonine protein kinase
MPTDQTTTFPAALPPLIGRARAIEDIQRALSQTRLLTLTGPGGCGKTSLALRVASEMTAGFGGAWIVELGALTDEALVAEVIAASLGLHVMLGDTTLHTLLAHLQAREALLVLDNCEHLLNGCVQVAEQLLRACPRLSILATSRELLRSPFEQVWHVPPLEIPDQHTTTVDEVWQYGAVHLLVARIQAVQPDFGLTVANAAPVAAICRRLDGLPLALELAAACAGALSLEQISEQLERGFQVLATGQRTAPPRQQALEATMAWSYCLLAPSEQALFRQLSVLASEFDLDVATAVAGDPADVVAAGLVQLVSKSLVLVVRREGAARYRLLETMRQYGHEQLVAASEEAPTRERYCTWVERHAFGSQAAYRGERAAQPDAREVDVEHLRAVLGWLVACAQHERALRLATTLQLFWRQRGYLAEGRRWLEAGLASPAAAVAPLVRARALNALGVLRMWQCAYPLAQEAHDEALTIYAALEEPVGLAWTHFRLGFLADKRGQYDVAVEQFEESLKRFTALGDAQGSDAARNRLGIVAWNQEDYDLAHELLAASLAFQRDLGTPGGLAATLLNLGALALDRDDHAQANALLHESLALNEALRDHLACAYVYVELGIAALLGRHLEQAEHALRQALTIPDPGGNPAVVLAACEGLAATHLLRGTPLHAARIWGATDTLRARYGLHLRPAERQRHGGWIDTARHAGGPGAFNRAWAEGTALSLMDTLDAATRAAPAEDRMGTAPAPSPTAAAVSTSHDDLSLRLWGLGAVRIERDGHLLSGRDLAYTRARDLLFYLLTYPARTRDQIGAALWPDASAEQLRTRFRVVLYHLRRALGDPAWIVRDRAYYRFDRARPHWYDVAAFEAAAREGMRLRQTSPDAAVAAFETARELYQGDFWEGVAGSDWIILTQERLRHTHLNTLLALGELYLDQGAVEQSLATFLPAVERDPYCEEAHRGVLRCYLRLHDHGRAIQHYERLRTQLAREMGVPPAPETAALLHAAW